MDKGMEEGKHYVALHPATELASGPPPELLMVMGALVMTAVNANVRLWPISLPVLIGGRYALQWIMCVVAILVRSATTKQPARFFGPPETRHWLLIRGALYYAFIWLWWETLRLVPLGNAVTVVKFECFVTGIGSCILFGEKLTARWWCCGLISVLGIILVSRPPFLFGGNDNDVSHTGLILNMLTPLVAGSLSFFVKLAPGAHFLEVQHVTDFVSGVVFLPVLLFLGNPADLLQPVVQAGVLSVAICGITALCLFITASQSGALGRLSLLSYVEVPASYFVQVVFFGGNLELTSVCGAVLVVGAAIAVALEKKA